jgi:hypothetical protein
VGAGAKAGDTVTYTDCKELTAFAASHVSECTEFPKEKMAPPAKNNKPSGTKKKTTKALPTQAATDRAGHDNAR